MILQSVTDMTLNLWLVSAEPTADEADVHKRAIERIMEEARVVSATALVLAGFAYNAFTSNLNHQMPRSDTLDLGQDNCTATNADGWCLFHILKLSYIITGSSGVMLLLCTALVAYQLSIECRRRLSLELVGLERFESLARLWDDRCLFSGFCGMVVSIGAEAISLAINHSDRWLTITCFVTPFALISALGLFISGRTFPFKE